MDTIVPTEVNQADQQEDFGALLSNPARLDAFIAEAKAKIRQAGQRFMFQPHVTIRGLCVTYNTPTTVPFCLQN